MPEKDQIRSLMESPADELDMFQFAGVVPVLRQLESGETLFRQGDATFGIFRLVYGRIRLVRVTLAGTPVPMHTARPGELFAEASLHAARYHCDAVALQACRVLVYPKADMLRQLRQSNEDLWAYAAELAQRVQGLRAALEVRQIRSARDRVLQALQLRCDAGGDWKPEGTLKLFAEDIGLTHEALYRALAALEKDGCILRDRNRIRVMKAG